MGEEILKKERDREVEIDKERGVGANDPADSRTDEL